jgi:LysR family hydrogen peroxide-inducible transcriptional activator
MPEMALGSSILRNTRVRLEPLDDNSYRTIGLAWRKGSGRTDEFEMLGRVLTGQQ